MEGPGGDSPPVKPTDANGDGGSETLNFTASESGTYHFVVYEATATPNGISSYTINASLTTTQPDTDPPSFGSFLGGISSATRLAGNTSGEITWNLATDNVTSANSIIYRIYYDTVDANVFAGAPEATQTGPPLSMIITGLDALTTYYVGVRAEDEAGNVDTNTLTLDLPPLPNAVGDGWTLYE